MDEDNFSKSEFDHLILYEKQLKLEFNEKEKAEILYLKAIILFNNSYFEECIELLKQLLFVEN